MTLFLGYLASATAGIVAGFIAGFSAGSSGASARLTVTPLTDTKVADLITFLSENKLIHTDALLTYFVENGLTDPASAQQENTPDHAAKTAQQLAQCANRQQQRANVRLKDESASAPGPNDPIAPADSYASAAQRRCQ